MHVTFPLLAPLDIIIMINWQDNKQNMSNVPL